MNSDPADTDQIEWPREIWAREKGEHDPVGQHVFSDAATVARFDGDTERDAEFHRYVDGDIHDSAERYWRERLTAAVERVEQERERDDVVKRCVAFIQKQRALYRDEAHDMQQWGNPRESLSANRIASAFGRLAADVDAALRTPAPEGGK